MANTCKHYSVDRGNTSKHTMVEFFFFRQKRWLGFEHKHFNWLTLKGEILTPKLLSQKKR